EHLAVIGIALQLFPAMPPEILDEEELNPGEQTVGPILQVVAEVDAGRAEIEIGAAQALGAARPAILGGRDLDHPAVEPRLGRALEEHEGHAVGAGIKPARIEQLEVQAAQPAALDRNQWRRLGLRIIDEGETGAASLGEQRLRFWADKAREEDRAG